MRTLLKVRAVSPTSKDKSHRHSLAFTIIELLTAMAVFSIILAMFFQILNGVLVGTHFQNQEMDSVASARRAVDVMGTDLQTAVIGQTSALLVPDTAANTNLLAFVTTRRGANTATNHRYLAVSYSTNSAFQLIRSYGSVDYTQANMLTAATTVPVAAPQALANGILAIQVRAIADGTNSYAVTGGAYANWATNNYNGISPPSGFKAVLTHSATFASSLPNRTRAFEIWIAAVNDPNYQLLQNSGKLPIVLGALGADPETWRSSIDGTSISPQSKSAIRIVNKTISVR